jgi:hypothetical protein
MFEALMARKQRDHSVLLTFIEDLAWHEIA